MAAIFRDPVALIFIDEDNRELSRVPNPFAVPRAGENVRLAGRPYRVVRVGYDIPEQAVTAVWVVCAPA